jgi:hypothetical protein
VFFWSEAIGASQIACYRTQPLGDTIVANDETPETLVQSPVEDPNAPMKLTTIRARVVVEIENDAGEIENFLLIEMTGALRDQWMNKTQTKMKTNSEGKSVGIKDFTGLHASLIAACLFTAVELKPVGEAKIQTFPASTQNALFKRAQKMNGLDDESEKTAKKD